MNGGYIDTVLHNDCIIGLSELTKNNICADLIVADPPYVISRKSNFHTMKDRQNARTGTSFGEWDEEFDNKPWIQAAAQNIKDGGSIIIFNDFKKISTVIEIATQCGLEYKDVVIWKKTNPMPRNRDRRYAPSIEGMVWFVKKKKVKWTFNRQDQSYENPIMEVASESGGAFRRYHPTQKPVKLIEKLILIHSNPGDLVIDPFMGSGTTAIAAINTNRHFSGFELNEEYCSIITGRIAEHRQKNSLTSSILENPSIHNAEIDQPFLAQQTLLVNE